MNQIQTDIRLKLLIAAEASLPVPAEFTYSLEDALAIHATFHAAGDTVDWVFSRDIVDAGLSGDSGVGDVRVWPGTDPGSDDGEPAKKLMYISLNSPEGQAILEVDADVIKAFLDQTYDLCPAGMEAFDVDALIADLLS